MLPLPSASLRAAGEGRGEGASIVSTHSANQPAMETRRTTGPSAPATRAWETIALRTRTEWPKNRLKQAASCGLPADEEIAVRTPTTGPPRPQNYYNPSAAGQCTRTSLIVCTGSPGASEREAELEAFGRGLNPGRVAQRAVTGVKLPVAITVMSPFPLPRTRVLLAHHNMILVVVEIFHRATPDTFSGPAYCFAKVAN
jgi:hypothetical protein